MKVVINRKYGGFGLSDKAVEACVTLGMTVANEYAGEDAIDKVDFYRARGIGCERYYSTHESDNAFRCDPRLVQVVEQLGEEANGDFAHLKVVDIPFDTTDGWEIKDYDGMERVEEIHKCWS